MRFVLALYLTGMLISMLLVMRMFVRGIRQPGALWWLARALVGCIWWLQQLVYVAYRARKQMRAMVRVVHAIAASAEPNRSDLRDARTWLLDPTFRSGFEMSSDPALRARLYEEINALTRRENTGLAKP